MIYVHLNKNKTIELLIPNEEGREMLSVEEARQLIILLQVAVKHAKL